MSFQTYMRSCFKVKSHFVESPELFQKNKSGLRLSGIKKDNESIIKVVHKICALYFKTFDVISIFHEKMF